MLEDDIALIDTNDFYNGRASADEGEAWERIKKFCEEVLKPSHNIPMAGAEPPQITPCPCEKDIACMNGSVGMDDCPKYVKTA